MEPLLPAEFHNPHPRALELIPEDFFWDTVDTPVPFGSEEGTIALEEFRSWRQQNPTALSFDYLKSVVETTGKFALTDYNESILDHDVLEAAVSADPPLKQFEFNRVDIAVIATGFGQFADEGIIETANKPIIHLAIERQKIIAGLIKGNFYMEEYLENLEVLSRVLKEA